MSGDDVIRLTRSKLPEAPAEGKPYVHFPALQRGPFKHDGSRDVLARVVVTYEWKWGRWEIHSINATQTKTL